MSKYVFSTSELSKIPVKSELFDVSFINSANFSVAFNVLKPGASVPEHKHVHETIDYIIEGIVQMTINGEPHLMEPGMVAKVPSNVPHSAMAITDCKVINIFYPVRDDFQ